MQSSLLCCLIAYIIHVCNGYDFSKPNVVYWECIHRRKDHRCSASVIQNGENFRRGNSTHHHPSLPDARQHAAIRAAVRKQAASNLFESAGCIVQGVLSADGNAQMVSAPNMDNLVSLAVVN